MTTSNSITDRPPAIHPLAIYLLSLSVIIIGYSLYAKFLVPLIEGPPNVVQRPLAVLDLEPTSSNFDKTSLVQQLSADAWENGDCKTLLSPQGTILFQKFERIEGGYLEVFPFTMVSQGPSSDGQLDDSTSPSPPTILRCLKGARLKFDNPRIDPLGGKSKMESAWLIGPVNIFRPASDPMVDDAISIATSNVQIDKHKIFTIDDVTFSFGHNQGSGKNLSIEFAHDPATEQVGEDFSSVLGIKRIELAFLDHLNLKSNPKSQPGSTPNASAVGEMDQPVSINCRGPFVFDLEERSATFHDQVVVEVKNKSQDNIQCEKLTAVFDESTLVELPSESQSQSASENWKLQKLIAEGQPAFIFSAGRESKISGDRLGFDLFQNTVSAERLSGTNDPVTIVSPDYHVVADRLNYQLLPLGELGPLTAFGSGKMLRPQHGDQPEFFVQWTQSLSVQHDGEQQLITMIGDCQVRIDRDTRINADKLEFWLNEFQVTQPGPDGSPQIQTEYRPARLIGQNNIEIFSPRLNGTTQKLTATWEHPAPSLDTKQSDMKQSDEKAFDRIPTHSLLIGSYKPTQFTSIQASRQRETLQPMADNPKKFAFRGNGVSIQLTSKNDQTEIKDLVASGNVEIAEITSAFAEDNQSPLAITGDSLRYVPQANEQVRLLVSGTPNHPATVISKLLNIEGQQIHLDQSANKLWVEGHGEIRMNHRAHLRNRDVATSQVAAQAGFPSTPTPDPSSTSPPNYQNVTVNWSGGMIFDGLKVYFENEVNMTAHGKNKGGNSIITTSTSEGLSLQLDRAINFRDLDSEKTTPPEVTEIVIVDLIPDRQRVFKSTAPPHVNPHSSTLPTIISNQTFDPNGRRVDQQKFVTSQATVKTQSGQINVKGPGVMMLHQTGKTRLLSNEQSPTSANTTDTRFSAGVRPAELTFVRVNFDGSAVANTEQKEVLIRGNVRTLYAGVSSFDQVYDPDQPSSLPADHVMIKCDSLKLAEWMPRNAEESSQEMLASGNAHITSAAFEATADRVSYSQSTDLLVVEGTPRSDAHLWFKKSPNSPQRDHLVAGKILYRLSDQSTEIQSVKNVNINGQ